MSKTFFGKSNLLSPTSFSAHDFAFFVHDDFFSGLFASWFSSDDFSPKLSAAILERNIVTMQANWVIST